MRSVASSALALSIALAACGGSPPPTEVPDSERLAPSNLYPLAADNVCNFNADTGEETPTLVTARVVRAEGNRFEVSTGGDPVAYEVRREGIWRPASEVWLLAAPIRDGASWPSSQGMTARVVSTSERIEVPAGTFEGCVRVEETGGEQGLHIVTVYCPAVGPVLVESSVQLGITGREQRVTARLLGCSFL